MQMKNEIRRILTALEQVKEVYKFGGVSKITIATPSYEKVLEDKCILITGGSSGIGLAIAKKCISVGAKVIITGRNESKLVKAIDCLGANNCHYLVWDVSKTSEVSEQLERCVDIIGGEVDILINNAGIAPSKFFGNVDEEEWNKIYDTNLKGNYFLTQEIVKRWKKSKTNNYRKIINISSQGGFVGATYPYRMTKWDLRGLTEGLGQTLIKDRIIVNGIAPGVVRTSMQEFSLQQGDNFFTNQNPIHRVCLPEEIAELAVFLISDACNFIVGQTIVCDGGYSLK